MDKRTKQIQNDFNGLIREQNTAAKRATAR